MSPHGTDGTPLWRLESACFLADPHRYGCTEREPEPLKRALASGLPELREVAAGMSRDVAAVDAALVHERSSGQVEGQVTRITLVKRQMYGRANLDLLRKRVILAT